MTAKKGKTTRRPTLETLEPRLLFSADILGAFGSALNPDQEVEVDSGVDTTSFIYVNNDSDDQSDLLDAGSGDDQRFELILIDANVDGYEALIEDLWANKDDQTDLEIVVLDPDTDGVDQITDILDDYAGLDAVHLISHGSGNGVQIGGTWLDADSLSANRDAVAAWGEALGQEADLLIYGCNLAATEAGTSLLDNLSLLIGADVAASDDPTGAEVLGGDWDLEHESGVVETDIAFSRQIQQQWSGILLDTTAPTIESKETVDLDGDGYIDALHITFSEAVDDTTVTIGNWDVEGVTGEAFSSTTNSDTADDSDIYITFTDGVLANDATPELIYTQGTLEDLAGNLLVSNSADAWWDESWQNRTKITFSGNDAGGSENLDNFTVLVSLTAADVDFDKIKADGADIRFMDSDNATELSYQIESWDDSAKTATIWVKVPRIDQGSTTDHIFLYYNNTDATDASSTAAWDSKYQGVWHMNEGTGVSQVDSTGNTNDASPVNSPVATDGKMGGGLTFSGTSQLTIGADATLDLSTYSDWTVSAWIKPTDYTGVKWPLVYGYGYYDASLGVTVHEGTDGLIENWTNDAANIYSNTSVNFNDWNHIAISRDATTTYFYLNGVQVGSDASTTVNTGNLASYIGGYGGSMDNQFLGLMDEVRVSAGSDTTASRSTEWMAAQYSSMNLTFNTLGAEEVATTDEVVPLVSFTRDDTNPATGTSVTFSADFSEDVTNVDATDFVVSLAGLTANSTVVVGDAGDTDASTYTVTVNTISGDGTVGLDVAGGNNITDAASNAVNTTPVVDEVYTVNQPPSFSITRDNTNPTSATSVAFSVDFTEDVLNVDAADFDLDLSGVTANATITVSDAGDADDSTYTVTVDTIAGDGTLGLDLAAGHNITDTGAGPINTTPTSDQVYTIDNTAPTVAITRDDANPASASSVAFSVNFSEDVSAVDATDFVVNNSGLSANSTVTVSDAGDSDASTYTVTVDTIAGVGTLGLDINGGSNIVDTSSNAVNGTPTTDQIYTVDTTLPENLVNTTTNLKQERSDVGFDADRNYVVVWSSKGQDGDADNEKNIYFQRYDSNGTAVGAETKVNTSISGNQKNPKVAVDDDGDFVVVWEGNGTQTGEVDADGIFFQRFNSSGIAQGDETLVNTSTTNAQKNTSVSMDADGDFVVVWEGDGSQVGEVDADGVFFQRFNASGVAQGGETLINTTTTGKAERPDVDMDSSGNFTAVWSNKGQGGDGGTERNVYFQQYDASGTAQGSETLVNTTITSDQKSPDVAVGDSGDFIVVWEGNGTQTGEVDSSGVFFQRFDSSRVAQGGETLVNTTTANNQKEASVEIDPRGNFLVTWEGDGAQTGEVDDVGVFYQQFTSDGSAHNGEKLINTTTADNQKRVSVDLHSGGDFVVVWEGDGAQAGEVDDAGVFSRLYIDIPADASITRDDSNPTNADSVVFSVDFSEDVTQVDATDFTLALTGVTANATVTVGDAGDADASTYTVTVDTIAGDGTIGLDFANATNIVDSGLRALNTTPTTDELYTIDNTAPTVAITRDDANPTSASSVVFSVDFSEDVSNVDATDFSLDLTGVTANTTVSVDDAGDADASTYRVTVDTIVDAAAGDGTLGLDIAGGNNVIDLAANALTLTPTTDQVYTLDHNDAPTLTATAVNPTFTEGGVNADLFSSVTINTVESGQTVEELKFTVTNVTDGTDEIVIIDGDSVALTNANSGTTATNSYGYSVSLSGTTATVTLTTTGTSEANAQTLVDGLAYKNTNNEPTTANRVATLTSIKDSGGTANGGVDTTALSIVSTVTVNEANDAPTLTATAVNPTFTEGGANADLFSSITINTVESGETVEELKFTVTNVTDGTDEIVVIDGDSVALTNANSGTTATNSYGYSVSLSGTTATVTLTTTGTSVANAQTLVDGLAYKNTSDNPTTSNRVATLTSVKDSGGTANGGVDTTVLSIGSTVSMSAVNDASVATNDNYYVVEDGTLNVAASGVLSNDDDAESDAMTVLDHTLPTNGTLTVNANGSFDYTPDPGYTGTDSFSYLVTDSNDGTVHYWKLDGNGNDAVGASNGAVSGTTSVDGHYGNGMSFDEFNDRVVIPDFSYTNEFTMSLRFKVDDISGTAYQYLYSHGAVNVQNSLNVFIGETGSSGAGMIRTALRDGNDGDDELGLDVDISALVGDGEWHSYTITVESGVGSKVYIDGVLGNSSANGGGAINPGTDLYLGARQDLDANRFYGGKLDSVQMVNRSLDATEVGDLDTGGAALGTVNITIDSSNDAPTLTATAVNPTFNEDGSNADLFSGVTIDTVEPGQTVEQLEFTVTNVTDGSDEIVVIDGDSITLTDSNTGTTGTSSYGYSVSVSGTTATVTLTTTGTSVADAQTLVDGLAYKNTNNEPTTANRVATLTSIKDSGGTANGGVDTTALSIASTVTVNEANDAPTLTATAVNPTFTEGGANADLFSSVTINTVESGETVEELKFTVTNVTDGTDEIVVIDGDSVALTNANSGTTATNSYGYSVSLSGTTATVTLTTTGTSEANAQTLIDGLAYKNTNNEPTTANRVATLTSVKDSGGTANGGVDTTALSIASTVTVNEANDAPTLTATAVNPTFTEGGANADLFSSVTIDTVESGETVEELKFTVTNVTDGTDEIVIIDGDSVALTNANSGTTATNSYGYSVSLSGTTATVTLTTTGTSEANAQTLVDGLAYKNTNNEPTTANRVATLTSVKDSGGTANGGVDTTALSIASTVTVNEANDAPTLTATAVNPTFTEGGANADLFSSVTINTIESGETVEELKFTVTNVTDGTDEIVIIDGDSVALTNANSGTTATNSYGYSVSLSGTTATVTLTTTGTSEASAQTLVDGLAYKNTNNDPTMSNRVATLTSVKDSGGTANGGVDTTALSIGSTVSMLDVNNAPTLTATAVNPTFNEDGSNADLFSGVTLNTIESGETVEELKFTVTNVTDGSGEVVVIDGDSVALTNANSGTTATNSYGYSVSLSGTTATVTLTTTGTSEANAQTLVDGLAYKNTNNEPTTANRVATLTSVKDSGGTANGGVDTTALSIASTVTVNDANDAPTLTATSINPTYSMGDPATDLFSGVTVDTVEAGETVEELIFTVTNVTDGADEIVVIDGDSVTLTNANIGTTATNSYGYSVSLSGTTATVTLTTTGTSVASAQTLVDGLAYQNTNGTPTIADRVTTLTSIKDSGGTANGGVDTTALSLTSTVNLSAINDAPTLTATAVNPTFTEGGSAADLFSGITVNTQESGQTIEELQLTVTNISNGFNEILIADGQAISLVNGSNGTTGTNSYGYNVSISGSDATITLTTTGASETDIQTLVDGFAYLNTDQNPGDDTRVASLTSIKDSGGTANGGVDTTTLSINSSITMVDVNDAPTMTLTPTDPSFVEGDAPVGIFSGTSIDTVEDDQGIAELQLSVGNVSDLDEELLFIDGKGISLTETATGTTNSGYEYSVNYAGSTATVTITTAGATISNAENLIDTLAYENTSDDPEISNRIVTLTSVQDDGGTPGVDTSSVSFVSTVSMSGVNDEPTVENPIDNQTATEDELFNFQFAEDVFDDPETPSLTYTASMSDDSALPAWLAFDATSRTFSGTPENDDVGTVSVKVTAGDEDGAIIYETFDITVENVNDDAEFDGVRTGSLTEDVDPDNDDLLESKGTLSVTDPDVDESEFIAQSITGSFGTLTIDTQGNWNYVTDNTQAVIQQLASGETSEDKLTVQTIDGTETDITITITGSDDDPTVDGQFTGTVAEDSLLATSGNITFTDIDESDDAPEFVNESGVPGDNGYGTFDMTDGNWVYTLNNELTDVQSLGAGESLTDTHSFVASDDSVKTVTITINGANEPGDIINEPGGGDVNEPGGGEDEPSGGVDQSPPTTKTVVGSVAEDGSLITSGQLFVVGSDESAVFEDQTSKGESNLGTFVLTNGSWTYELDNELEAVQTLDAGEHITDSHEFVASDGTVQKVSVTIDGAEDAAVVVGDFTATVTVSEDGPATTGGALSVVDVDIADAGVKFVDEELTAGDNGFGEFALTDGIWTYTLDQSLAEIQGLGPTDSVTDTHSFVASDGSKQVVRVTINGSENSAPPAAVAAVSAAEALIPTDNIQSSDTQETTESVEDVIESQNEVIQEAESAVESEAEIESETENEEVVAEESGNTTETETGLDIGDELSEVLNSMDEAGSEFDQFSINGQDKTFRDDSQTEGQFETGKVIQPKFASLESLDISDFEAEDPRLIELKEVVRNDSFFESIQEMSDDLDESIGEQNVQSKIVSQSLAGITLGVTTGILSWVLRAGSLFAAFMSVVPMWKQFDPLPILDNDDEKDLSADDEEENGEENEVDKMKAKKKTNVESIFDYKDKKQG